VGAIPESSSKQDKTRYLNKDENKLWLWLTRFYPRYCRVQTTEVRMLGRVCEMTVVGRTNLWSGYL